MCLQITKVFLKDLSRAAGLKPLAFTIAKISRNKTDGIKNVILQLSVEIE